MNNCFAVTEHTEDTKDTEEVTNEELKAAPYNDE